MKKVLFFISALCMFACSQDANIDLTAPMMNESHEVSNGHEIDAAKALEYANIYFNQTETRSSAPLKMDYIVDKTLTRSGDMADDTIAYIINRGVNEGFVVISSDDRVYPILAHSDNGTFVHEEGSIVDVEFVSRISNYIAQNEEENSKVVTEDELDGCYSGTPVLGSSWGQRSPFDAYVIMEYPGCPVGCVAVATGQIMANCKPTLNYHGVNFNFKKMLAGIANGTSSTNETNPETRIVNGEVIDTTVVPFPYDVAVDYAAQLMYWVGNDVGMNYTPSSSGAQSYKALELLHNKGYHVRNNLTTYNLHDIISFLEYNHLIYMRGSNRITGGGHAWVADAARYCYNHFTNDTTIAEIHCDWGWYGNCNGYFSGEVFAAAGNRQYHNMEYSAVIIE